MFIVFVVIFNITSGVIYNTTDSSFAEEAFEYLNMTNYANPTKEILIKIRPDFNTMEFERNENNEIVYMGEGGAEIVESLRFGMDYVQTVRKAFEEDDVSNSYYFRNGKNYYISAFRTEEGKVRTISVREFINDSGAMLTYKRISHYLECQS